MTTKEKLDADVLAKKISVAINEVDESLSYELFAKAITTVIKEEYGSHNVTKFFKELHSNFNQ